MRTRHIIHALRKKPMALLNPVYRDQRFPSPAYKRALDALLTDKGEKIACRTTVGLVALAPDRAWVELADAIEVALDAGEMPNLDRHRITQPSRRLSSPVPSLSTYDELAVVCCTPNSLTLCEGALA